MDELLDVARIQMGSRWTSNGSRRTWWRWRARSSPSTSSAPNAIRSASTRRLAELVGEWDGRRLGRVLGNLLDNAIKYSPDGGIIRYVSRSEDGPAGWAVMEVEDDGIGIPEDELEQIFGRFQRGTNVVGQIAGSGIGLASARQIVENHGGTLTAASGDGAGCTLHDPHSARCGAQRIRTRPRGAGA